MKLFFAGMNPDQATEIDRVAKAAFEMRENRKQLLEKYQVESEVELKEKIASGTVAEHPAYEDYLSAKLLREGYENIRAGLKEHLLEVNKTI